MTAEPRSRGPLYGAACIALLACSAAPSGHGGETVASEELPITSAPVDQADAAVVALTRDDEQLICTGTIVAPRAVLTAAHCVALALPTKVFLGQQLGVGGAWVAVDSVVYHPGFDFVTMSYDVAIVRLAEEVHVTPVPLLRAAKNAPVVGDNVRVAGFGLEGPDDASPASKRSGTSVVSGMYGGDRFVLRGGPSQPCRGDSGGPAFLTVGGDEVLAGITSEGDAECASHSIETRVDAYAGFIDAAISDGEVVAARGGCAVAAGERNPGVPLLTVVCAALAVIRRALRRSRRGDLRVSDDRERQDRHMVNA